MAINHISETRRAEMSEMVSKAQAAASPVIKNMLWGGVIVASIIGSLIATGGVLLAGNVMQQISYVAIGLTCSVIPYCIARAATEIIG
jgi:hypothetical protein